MRESNAAYESERVTHTNKLMNTEKMRSKRESRSTSSSRRALSHSFCPGACWVHMLISWLMLSVTALSRETHTLEFARKGRNSAGDLWGTIHPHVCYHTLTLSLSDALWGSDGSFWIASAVKPLAAVVSSRLPLSPRTHIREQQRYKQVCFYRCLLHNCAHSKPNV